MNRSRDIDFEARVGLAVVARDCDDGVSWEKKSGTYVPHPHHYDDVAGDVTTIPIASNTFT